MLFMKKKILRMKLIAIVLFTGAVLFSCQPMLKLYLGIKKFETYVGNEERIKYYDPVLEGSYDISLYSIKNEVDLNKVFDTINDYPQIYVHDLKDSIVYRLNCYADVEYVVNNIQKDDYWWWKYDKAEVKKQYNLTEKLLKDKTIIAYKKNRLDTIDKDSLRYDILFISAPFLGKKLRRKSLPVFEMKNINKVKIVDLSVDTTQTKIN